MKPGKKWSEGSGRAPSKEVVCEERAGGDKGGSHIVIWGGSKSGSKDFISALYKLIIPKYLFRAQFSHLHPLPLISTHILRVLISRQWDYKVGST